MPENVLAANLRSETGKGPVGRLRREGKLPAVFYGRNKEARSIVVDYKEFKKAIFSDTGTKWLFKISLEGEEKTVMLKEHQIDPIKRTSMHADFYEVDADRALQVEVPVLLEGASAGVDEGGMLQQVRHTLMVSALPHLLPEQLVIDVSAMQIGDSIHIGDVQAPEGVELVDDASFTVATIVAPRAEAEEEAEEGEAEEGEGAASAAEESGGEEPEGGEG